jgi:hypothetical protein
MKVTVPTYTVTTEFGQIVMRGGRLVTVMCYVAGHDGTHTSQLRTEEFENFRLYVWQIHPKLSGALRRGPTLSATVCRSSSPDADEHLATQILGEQFMRHADQFWTGSIETDQAHDDRLTREANQLESRRLEKAICTDVINDLITVGYRFTGNHIQIDREFERSTERDCFLRHVLQYEEAEFTLHGDRATHWIRFCLDSGTDKIIESYSAALSWIVDPIILKHLGKKHQHHLADNHTTRHDDDDDDTFIVDDDLADLDI